MGSSFSEYISITSNKLALSETFKYLSSEYTRKKKLLSESKVDFILLTLVGCIVVDLDGHGYYFINSLNC